MSKLNLVTIFQKLKNVDKKITSEININVDTDNIAELTDTKKKRNTFRIQTRR